MGKLWQLKQRECLSIVLYTRLYQDSIIDCIETSNSDRGPTLCTGIEENLNLMNRF